jgi:hypothetical protein
MNFSFEKLENQNKEAPFPNFSIAPSIFIESTEEDIERVGESLFGKLREGSILLKYGSASTFKEFSNSL